MTKKKSMIFAQIGLFLVLGLSSFADETAQVTFALHLAKSTASISMLLFAGLIGGIYAGSIAPRLLHRFQPAHTITVVLLFEALFIATAAIANQFWLYIALSFALGCAGSIFWSTILIAIPEFANNDHQLDHINRIIQTVRNLGYIAGPLLGGILYSLSSGQKGLFALSIIVLCAALITIYCFKSLKMHVPTTNMAQQAKKGLDLTGLLRKKMLSMRFPPSSSPSSLPQLSMCCRLSASAPSYSLVQKSVA